MRSLSYWLIFVLSLVGLTSCDGAEKNALLASKKAQEKDAAYHGRCTDTVVLLGTTAGSPNHAECTHKNHRVQVQAIAAGSEEVAATVTCKCLSYEDPAKTPGL